MIAALSVLGFLLVLLLLGVPVSFATMIAGSLGVTITVGFGPLGGVLAYAPYEEVASFTLSSLPMFILMAEFLRAGRFTADLFNLTYSWVGHLRGGISYAAVGGGVLLAAISGSSTAAASTLAFVAFPEMRRFNYDAGFSAALLAVVGTLAIMIPPSLGLILYGVYTETSVGRLLVAGLIPGVITALGYVVTIWLLIRRKPDFAPRSATLPPLSDRLSSVGRACPVIALLGAMLFGLYSGIITATEVGAVGACLTLLTGVLMKRIGVEAFWSACVNATRTSAMVLTIVGFSAVIGVFMALNGTTGAVLTLINEAGLPPLAVLILVLLILIVLGFFLDQLAILILTLPITFPILTGLGYDPVWMGVIFVKTAEIGLITPPMGLNVFVVAGVTRIKSSQVFRNVWPFVLVEFLTLALLVTLPALSLWLPGLMHQ